MSFHRILIALDDSAIAAHAAEVGAELATALKAQAALVYVVDSALAFQPDGGVPAADLVAALKTRRPVVSGGRSPADRRAAGVTVPARRETG